MVSNCNVSRYMASFCFIISFFNFCICCLFGVIFESMLGTDSLRRPFFEDVLEVGPPRLMFRVVWNFEKRLDNSEPAKFQNN